MNEQKYTSNRMVTANVIRGYKNHIEELKEKMEQYDQEISRISNLVENLEGLVDMDEKHETTIEDVIKFISTSTNNDKNIIKSALGVNNMGDDGFMTMSIGQSFINIFLKLHNTILFQI